MPLAGIAELSLTPLPMGWYDFYLNSVSVPNYPLNMPDLVQEWLPAPWPMIGNLFLQIKITMARHMLWDISGRTSLQRDAPGGGIHLN